MTTKSIRSHVNDIPDVSIDDKGVIHTPYGSYHPVTGEGLPIDAPQEMMRQILGALIQDGLDSPLVDFDINRWFEEEFGDE